MSRIVLPEGRLFSSARMEGIFTAFKKFATLWKI
jgi:hypothetical protein